MYYELYIDIFLCVNIFLDFIILSALKKILKLEGGLLRRIAASVLGSLLLCVYLLTDLRFLKFGYIFTYIIICGCMILIAFKIVSFFALFKALVYFYAVSLCLNGIFNQLVCRISSFRQILLWAVVIYIIFCILRRIIMTKKRNQKTICEIKIYIDKKEIATTGLWDTGNCLISPYHNRGVSIVEYDICEPYINKALKYKLAVYLNLNLPHTDDIYNEETKSELLYEKNSGNVFAVPYKTISSSNAVLPVIQVEKITIKKEGEILEYPEALLGIICGNLSQNGDYHTILTTKN